MSLCEINFDGIVGPSHNYAGLSFGNVASMRHAGAVSQPRAAALQGIDKMRANLALGLAQGIFLPHPRPHRAWLAELGIDAEHAEPALFAAATSASAMWAANAATVSPAPDTADGRCHLTVANLRTMPHRSHEWPATLAQLGVAFGSNAFAVHAPVPPAFGDEGAANHMRLAGAHGEPGVELFVYGVSGGAFPARQHVEASTAIARLHRLDPERVIFAAQSEEAIAAGAFHNDVVAVANQRVLFAHEKAFADRSGVISKCERLFPELQLVEVPASEVPLADAISSYLFNAQLVSLLDGTPVFVSDPLSGNTHDKTAFEETPVAEIVSNSGGGIGDKGYQGTDLATPRKKPKGGELSKRDKENNAAVSALRAPIERVVAHFKNWTILHTDYRRPYSTYRETYDAARGLFFFSINWEPFE